MPDITPSKCQKGASMASIHRYIPVHTSTYFFIPVHRCPNAPCLLQATILVVPLHPYCIDDDLDDVQLEDCWYARPKLFFSCHLRPTGGRPPKNLSYRIGPDYLLFHLVFFSTFEDLKLPIHGPMEDAGVLKLYEPSPTPCLYVASVANMVGRVPLLSLYLAGYSTPTHTHKFSKHKGSGFPMGCANTAPADGRRGSNVYAVNPWLGQFRLGKPRLGGLTVEEAALKKDARREEQAKRSVETRRHRKADRV